ncbi:MAG: kelch repeat-containing protein, partial [Verrucomicrobiota bacterium]
MNRESLRRSGTFILAFILALAVTANAADSFVWITRTPCPLVRFEGIGGACAGRLYQFSGYYTGGSALKATPECDAYDPATNRWTRLADIPQPISHSGQAVDDDGPGDEVFWLAGGFLGDHPGPSTSEVWKYSVKDNTWTPGPPLPEERGGGALVRIGRELHYFGGVVRKNGVALQDYGTHWALDLDGGTAWRTITTTGDPLTPLP